jgi:hypothetical protein
MHVTLSREQAEALAQVLSSPFAGLDLHDALLEVLNSDKTRIDVDDLKLTISVE